jgi:hypothetical protein
VVINDHDARRLHMGIVDDGQRRPRTASRTKGDGYPYPARAPSARYFTGERSRASESSPPGERRGGVEHHRAGVTQ